MHRFHARVFLATGSGGLTQFRFCGFGSDYRKIVSLRWIKEVRIMDFYGDASWLGARIGMMCWKAGGWALTRASGSGSNLVGFDIWARRFSEFYSHRTAFHW
jgi:hypothetical protein